MEIKKILLEQKNIILLIGILILSDYAIILASEGAAYWLRMNIIPQWNGPFFVRDVFFYFVMPVIYLAFLHLIDTNSYRIAYWKQAQKLFSAVCYATLVVVLLMYLGGISGGISRLFIFMNWLFVLAGIIISRYFIRKIIKRCDAFDIPVIFVGAGKTAELLMKAFLESSTFNYKVLGFVDDAPKSDNLAAEYKILGEIKDIGRIVDETGVKQIIITAPGLEKEKLLQLVNSVQLKVNNLIFVPDLLGIAVGNISVDGLFNEKVLMLRIQNNLSCRYNQWLKRCFDLFVSSIGIIALLPVFVIISAAIYIASPGPVFFSHQRVGQNGKLFPCYKFRSMVMNAQQILEDYLAEHPELRQEWEENFKLKDDPRVTGIGAFLRKTSLDELPQLFNVLKGEMSLVGPRPIITAEVERYREYINDYYLVLPGITGMWQVNGRSDTTYDERVAMDSWYVRNWSLWIDIVFLFKTVGKVLKREGAY